MEKELREGKAFHPGEKEWRMDSEDEIEGRKKLDEQRKKLQKDLRDVEKLSCVSNEVQESLKKCSRSCRRWRKRGMTSCRSIKKYRKYQKDTKHLV